MQAVGIKKAPGSQVAQDKARGLLRTWEPVKADGSNFGCGVVVDPAQLTEFAELDGNVLAVTKLSAGGEATYYAGSDRTRAAISRPSRTGTATSTRPRSGFDRRSPSRWRPGRSSRGVRAAPKVVTV